MGKIEDQQLQQIEENREGETSQCEGCCSNGLIKIARVFSFKCLIVLILSACVFLSAIFWLPPFHPLNSEGRAADPTAPVQASFRLQKPASLLTAHTKLLEYDIMTEIGMPNMKVSIISLLPVATSNWTSVLFGFLPDPINAPINPWALSVLKSSLIGLVLQQSNLSLTPSIFGRPSSFELLEFPGGITVIPVQPASIWQKPQVLFNFTLNNSISQIQQNLDQLKGQLKYGLQLRSYENVYVTMTNANGSTLDPPVVVQASVLSDVGGSNLLPQRLRQLAQTISGSHAKNLGLNHTVFGKVKEVRLSSYLNRSLSKSEGSPSPSPSSSPSPSPSPSPSLLEANPYSEPPASHYPDFSPSYPPAPSADNNHLSPCFHCDTSYPPENTYPYGPTPDNGLQAPSPSWKSPAPSAIPTADSPARSSCPGTKISPSPSPEVHSYPSAPSYFSPQFSTLPYDHHPLAPTSQMVPDLSPSPAVYDPSPGKDKRSRTATSSMLASSPMSPSLSSKVAGYPMSNLWLIGLAGTLLFHFLC